MYQPGYGYESRDDGKDGLAPYGSGAAVCNDRDDYETDLDDHDAPGLCGDDHIGGCFL